MAYMYSFDAVARLVTIRGGGEQLLAEAKKVTDRVLADRRIGDDSRVLVVPDMSTAPPSSDDVAGLATLVKLLRTRVRGRIAIIAPRAALMPPATLISLLGTGPSLGNIQEVRAFASEEEGQVWALREDGPTKR